MAEQLKGSSPIEDYEPTVRDIFARIERTMPVIEDAELMAKYLGVPVYQVERRGILHYSPMVLAKWRYACADAMIRARGK